MADLSTADRVLGAEPVARVLSTATGSSLRILAYHGVGDPAAFRRQLALIAGRYRPVSGAEVAAAFAGGPALPRDAVWVTFDDGRADVVEAGLGELDAAGVPATMFICPGLVEAGSPFWWDVVTGSLEAAGPVELDGRTWTDRRLVTHLKTVPDARRRAVVAELAARGPVTAPSAVLTVDHLGAWTASGHEIGNHTWDHPCLDQCDPAEQRRQIERAHESLTSMLGAAPTLFAYPNGDWADAAERALVELGYRVGLLFDHRLTRRGGNPLRLSRLRLDSDAPVERASAILAGGHSGVFHLRERVATVARRGGRGAAAS